MRTCGEQKGAGGGGGEGLKALNVSSDDLR